MRNRERRGAVKHCRTLNYCFSHGVCSIMLRLVPPLPCLLCLLQVRDMAKKLGGAGLQLLVIDTENKFVSTGETRAAQDTGVLPAVP